MRIKQTNVYHYDELSEKAKEKARAWFRRDYPYYDWWDYLYKGPKDESTLMCMVPQNTRREDASPRDGVARDLPGVRS